MKYTALVPVKSLEEAKSRLAAHLTPTQRASLMLDMLHHVLSTLQESQLFDHVSVVSADPRVLQKAQAWHAQALVETQAGHNPALTAAAMYERQQGASALLTISADLPLLQVDDVHQLVVRSKSYDVVIATSQDGSGTNALLTRPPLVLPYLFGINSRYRHQREAERLNLSCSVQSSLGLALDIDTIEDITALQRYEYAHQ
ncbi:hypothetical protein KDA_01380 [Dictyobacter alpinus]|uniref:Phosphoenolpyruvate guanylyltransferase n=1 Tax=Dictyobacter alpinus TaxID=2014873 RepID=A0A402AZX6_9CHLR|nr:2-phospho-L-lactate guanylyltransferase [Dictyobacter alpinus]GCE24654.1 hypothetical protein KDA_01380 [Dictyobacter alpinus]